MAQSNGNGTVEKFLEVFKQTNEKPKSGDSSFVLIVGLFEGLARELATDIVYSLYQDRDLNDDDKILKILREVQTGEQRSFVLTFPKNFPTKFVDILVQPSWDELKNYLQDCLPRLLEGSSTKIAYCGHGTDDGCLVLPGDFVTPTELADCLIEASTDKNFGDFRLFLNSCNGTATVAEMMCTAEWSRYEVDNTVTAFMNSAEKTLPGIMQQLGQLAPGGWLNLKIPVNGSERYLGLYPLSTGALRPEGDLWAAFTNGQNVHIFNEKVREFLETKFETAIHGILSTERGKTSWYFNTEGWKELMPAKRDEEAFHEDVANPTLIVFQAKNGDSTLLRWHDVNILIDGGVVKKDEPPCYWDYVKKLKQIDLMILTHGDDDHVGGLFPFITRNSGVNNNVNPSINKIFALDLKDDDSQSILQPLASGRNWSLHCDFLKHSNAWKNLFEVSVSNPFYTHTFSDHDSNDVLELHLIWPNADILNKIKAMIKQSAGKTNGEIRKAIEKDFDINNVSLVFYALIKRAGTEKFKFLFTGDSNGKRQEPKLGTILQGLGSIGSNFDYVDAPHHGSDLNEPEDFFKDGLLRKSDAVKDGNNSVIMISTDGSRFGHPGQRTLTTIRDNILTPEGNKKAKLYFNYHHNWVNGKSEVFKDKVYEPRLQFPTEVGTPVKIEFKF